MSEKKKKSCCLVKWILLSLGSFLSFVLVILLTLPLWISHVVTSVANKKVPEMTQTDFHLGEFELNPYSGKVHVGDLQLQNPERFFVKKEAEKNEGVLGAVTGAIGSAVEAAGDALVSHATNAVSLVAADVSLAMGSLLSDTIVIEEIVVRNLELYGDLTFSNIREIVANAVGDAEKMPDAEEAKTTEAAAAEPETSAKKVVIGRVFISGTKIQWGHLTVSVPDIEIKDIGKDEAVSEEGAIDRILDGLCAAADNAKIGLGTALKTAINGGRAIGKGIGAAVDGVGKAAGAVVDGAAAVTEGVGKAAEAVTDTAAAAVGTVTDGIGTAAGAVTEGVSKTAGAVTESVGKAAEAVSEKAGKAMDAVKGLFK